VIKKNIFIIAVIFTTIPNIAHSYLGPGLALGTIVLTIGLVAVLFFALIAILYYPIKKLIKKIKLKKLKKDKLSS